MIRFIFNVIVLFVILGRLFLIYKLTSWVIINYNNPECSFSNIQWYIGVMVLDFYLTFISKNIEIEVNKKTT